MSNSELAVLVFNSGSSSLKLALYSFQNGNPNLLAQAEAEEIGSDQGRVWLRGSVPKEIKEARNFSDTAEAAQFLIHALGQNALLTPNAVGHRIVHGGPNLREHQRITPRVLEELNRAIRFAPIHLPPALHVVRETADAYPDVPQIACFDTAFHRTIPEYAARLPFAREFWDRGIRRYGFHGLVCESVVRSLGNELPARSVLAHLGNGCSLTAMINCQSVETTMGLTPTGGVMMGTRPGDLDPGVLLNLMSEGYDQRRLDSLLNHHSGLLGVSGKSSDMRELLQARDNDADARLAIEMFCYSIRKSIGALTTVLGGIDMLIFSGGIGEHAPAIRAEICSGLEYLGIALDEAVNGSNSQVISALQSRCKVRVVEADEDLEIALHVRKVLSG
jgi:acetate kinase